MHDNIQIFVEKQRYLISDYQSIIDSIDIADELIKKDLNGFEFKITGFIITCNKPLIIFPKNYHIPSNHEQIKKECMTLLQVILKYRMEKFHVPEEMQLLFGDENHSTGRIVSSIELIEDYLRNGFIIKKREIVSSKKIGYTDWNATVNKLTPVITHGKPIYLQPVKRNKVYDTDNLLTKIHKWVINDCICTWGWLFGIDENILEIANPYDSQLMINVLKNELIKTFIQRDVSVIKNLINYIEAKHGSEKVTSYNTMATPYFNLIWESICAFVYSNEYANLSKWVAQPVWDGPIILKNISQRPDILFVNYKTFYILDAKYYDYHNTIPGWHDVVKQLFYKFTIESKLRNSGNKTIESYENVLIFPENSKNDFTYLGRVYVDGVMDLGEVKAFAINTKCAMEAYSSGRKDKFRDELLIQIEKVNIDADLSKMRIHA